MSNRGRDRRFFLAIEEDGQEDYEEDSDDEYEELFDTKSPMKQIDFNGDYGKLVTDIIDYVHIATLMEVYFRIKLYGKLNVYIRIADIYLLGLEIIRIFMRRINVEVDNGKQKKAKKGKKKRGGRRDRQKKVKEDKGKEALVEEEKEKDEKIFVFGTKAQSPRYFKNSKFIGFGEGYPGGVKLNIGKAALERAVHHVVNTIKTDPHDCIAEIFAMVLMLCEGPRFKPLFEYFKEVENESPKPLVGWLINDWEVMSRVARTRTEYHMYEKPTDLTKEEEVKKLKKNPAWTDDNLSIKHDHLNDRHSGSVDVSVLKRIIRGLASDENAAKCNALDDVSKFNKISSSIPHKFREELARHLLNCLEDEEFISARATKLLKRFDPALVLPELVLQVGSSDSASHSYLTSTLLEVLNYDNENPRVISMMLDCISHNLIASSDNLNTAANGNLEGLNGDAVNRVFKLIPDWSRSVTNWKLFIAHLVEKMLADPSNPVILKFLDQISDYLGGEAALVFERILSHTESKTETVESSLNEVDICQENDVQLEHSHIDRLCPLLILRLLPCKVFNDLGSSRLYGDLHSKTNNTYDINGTWCIATLLLRRAFKKLEFEDVRNLSAELCGWLHPNVLFPTVSSELECATNDDILKIKACLLSICTSLVVGGMDSVCHPVMSRVKNAIGRIMLLQPTGGGEISEARDGCIDCFAAMVCTELQDSKTSSSMGKNNVPHGTFHKRVINRLIGEENPSLSTEQFLSYRLCMANVLTSACQKISDSGKTIFGLTTIKKITPSIIQQKVKEPKIRAACIDVLCTIVDQLKSAILPCSCDLLRVSLNFLQLESEKDRIGGAKLMSLLADRIGRAKLMSLLTSDEVILPEEARTLILAKLTSAKKQQSFVTLCSTSFYILHFSFSLL